MSAEIVQDNTTEQLGMRNHHLFRDDVVESAFQPGLLGLVVSYSGNPDPYFDEDYNEDEQEEQDSGHVLSDVDTCTQVLWLNATEPVEAKVADLRLVDRTLSHNDVVRWASTPGPPLGQMQMGKVVNISILLDLEMEDGTVAQQVDSKAVNRVRSIATGDVVVKGPWVGRVVGVEENITIELKDGTKCKIMEADPKTLVPTSSVDEDEEFPYYPGQQVRAKSAKTFKKATWLGGGRRKSNTLDATVVDVETAVVDVKWVQNQHDVDGAGDSREPEEEQKPKGLAVLAPFSYADWALGKRCMQSKSIGRIVNIKTKADVLWQNGELSCGIDSYDLIHTKPTKELDFWPRQYVRERGTRAKSPRNGVVKRIDSEERTAVVQWMKPEVADQEEEVGIRQIAHKSQEADKLGDLVFRLSPKSASASRGGSKSQQPWVGCIRRFTMEGDIEVIWQDESVSSVKPSDVKIQAYENDDPSSSDSGSESDSDDDIIPMITSYDIIRKISSQS